MDQRDWEDSVLDARLAGTINDAACTFGMLVARTITWGERPAVYWNGGGLWAALSVTRPTFYRLRSALVAAGLLTVVGGNMTPVSLNPETVSLNPETESLNPETESLNPETNMLATTACSSSVGEKRPTLGLTAATTGEEINATFSVDQQAERIAAVFVVKCLRYWPEAQRPSFSQLARHFTEALDYHSLAVVHPAAFAWLGENRESDSMRSPAAVFMAQSEEIYAARAQDRKAL